MSNMGPRLAGAANLTRRAAPIAITDRSEVQPVTRDEIAQQHGFANHAAMAAASETVRDEEGGLDVFVVCTPTGEWLCWDALHTSSAGRPRLHCTKEEAIDAEEWRRKTLREEWRDLGFYYQRDECGRFWRFAGSRSGLLSLCFLLLKYAYEQENAGPRGEHTHYTPYMSLTVMTWDEPGINAYAIYGTQNDLRQLALLIEDKLYGARAGDHFWLRNAEYVGKRRTSGDLDNRADLRFEVHSDDCDPAALDPYSCLGIDVD